MIDGLLTPPPSADIERINERVFLPIGNQQVDPAGLDAIDQLAEENQFDQSIEPDATLTAEIKDVFAVSLEGLNWIFLGSSSISNRQVDLVSSECDDTICRFEFRANAEEIYQLQFQSQSLTVGTTNDYIVLATIVEEGALIASAGTPLEIGNVRSTQIEPLNQSASQTTPAREQEMAAENKSAEISSEAELIALADSAAMDRDFASAAFYIDDIVNRQLVPTYSTIIDTASWHSQREQPHRAFEYLDYAKDQYPLSEHTDQLYWMLANLHDIPGDRVDLTQAIDFYKTLIAEYPLSDYYQDARERVEYLQRNYFDIR